MDSITLQEGGNEGETFWEGQKACAGGHFLLAQSTAGKQNPTGGLGFSDPPKARTQSSSQVSQSDKSLPLIKWRGDAVF